MAQHGLQAVTLTQYLLTNTVAVLGYRYHGKRKNGLVSGLFTHRTSRQRWQTMANGGVQLQPVQYGAGEMEGWLKKKSPKSQGKKMVDIWQRRCATLPLHLPHLRLLPCCLLRLQLQSGGARGRLRLVGRYVPDPRSGSLCSRVASSSTTRQRRRRT